MALIVPPLPLWHFAPPLAVRVPRCARSWHLVRSAHSSNGGNIMITRDDEGEGPTMNTRWRKVGAALAIALTMTWLSPSMTAGQDWRGSAQATPFALVRHEEGGERVSPETGDPRTMTPGDWQALAQKVATNLHWIGIQMGAQPQQLAVFVPLFTQEYLQAFQVSLMQGSTKRQADILASQYIFARIQQMAAQSGGAPGTQGGDGCVHSRGGSFCAGSDGFRSFSFSR